MILFKQVVFMSLTLLHTIIILNDGCIVGHNLRVRWSWERENCKQKIIEMEINF